MSAVRKSASLCVQNWRRSRSAFIRKLVLQNDLRPEASPPPPSAQFGGLALPAARHTDGGVAAWEWSGSVTSCIPMGYSARTSPPCALFSWRDGGQGAGPRYWRAGLATMPTALVIGGRGWRWHVHSQESVCVAKYSAAGHKTLSHMALS
jgi:hypothetical protein